MRAGATVSILISVALATPAFAGEPGLGAAKPASAGAPEPGAAKPAPADEPKPVAPAPELVAPRQVHAPTVPYPPSASGSAVVLVQLVVAVDGHVESATVVAGDEPFAAAARTAALEFRFEPATRGGVPVRATIRAKIAFTPPVVEPPPEPPGPSTSAPGPQTKPPSPPKDTPIDLVVEGERKELATTTIGGGEVKVLPGAFGDPFRAIESMPGVTPLINGLPFFYVRGAPPGNTGYFIDGVKVPMLFHLGAGPAVIAPGLIDHVDFHPGGYPARFGRFTGGVVAGETIGGPTKRHGEWNVRLFDASAMVEQPIADGKGEALLAGRYGYPGLLLSLASPDTGLQYWDYQVRAGYRPTDRDRVSVFFFGAFDRLVDKARDQILFDAQFHRGDLRWDRKLEGGTLRVATTLMFDQSGLGEDNGNDPRFAVRMLGVGARAELEKRVDPAVLVRAGADLWLERYRLVGVGDVDGNEQSASLFPTRADLMAGLRADAILRPSARVELVPGVRFDVYSQGNTTVPALDPRLATRLRVARNVWAVTTLGVSHQTPSFLIPFPGLRMATLGGGLQEVHQMAQGAEIELPQRMKATATVFRNAFRKLSDGLSVCLEQSGDDCDLDTRVPGRSYGLELLFKRDLTQRIGGWIAYTLSRSERSYRNVTFLSSFDRTHVFTAAGSVNLGLGFRFGARFASMSGRPAEQSFSLYSPPVDGPDATAPDGAPLPLSLSRGRVRLPAFHRLDLRLEKRWASAASNWALVLEWYNALLQEEATAWRCDSRTLTCKAQYVGPVTIPSVGLEGSF